MCAVNQNVFLSFVDKENIAPKIPKKGRQKGAQKGGKTAIQKKRGQNILLVTPHGGVRPQVQAPILSAQAQPLTTSPSPDPKAPTSPELFTHESPPSFIPSPSPSPSTPPSPSPSPRPSFSPSPPASPLLSVSSEPTMLSPSVSPLSLPSNSPLPSAGCGCRRNLFQLATMESHLSGK